MSRLSQVQDAVRPAMKARLMLAGPAGSGKTHTALTVAEALTPNEKWLLIDTEEESALTYADRFSFRHLAWAPPFNPQELAQTVAEAASQYPGIIIDSASHFWNDDGGTLDVAGGKFTGWKAARPMQRDLIVAVLRAPTHMIVCVRSKMEHSQELDSKTGKQVVTKLGMAPIQDSTFEYEMNVSAELDMTHKLSISKTRCEALDNRQYPAGHAADMGTTYREWLESGATLTADEVEELRTHLNALSGEARGKFKMAFGGNLAGIPASRLDDARSFVAGYGMSADDGPDERGTATPVGMDMTSGSTPGGSNEPAGRPKKEGEIA